VRRYLDILRSPYVGALVASALIARLPIGINALAIVLYLREATGSFAVAGTVAGTLAAGSGIGAPVQGRLVDRMGARRVLLPLAVVHAVALGAVVAFAELSAPTAVLGFFGFTAGFAVPPTSSVLRSMWTELLEPRLHQAAYALDSTMIELIFISGPLLTAVIATVASPAAALIVSAIAVIGGTAVFTALPPTRRAEPAKRESRGPLGALASPGVRTLVFMSLPTGIGIGMLEVGIPAFSRAEHAAATAGVLLAIWSLGSLLGGLLYGTLPRRRGLHGTHLLLAAVLPLTLLPLAAASSVWVMALLVIPAGCCIAPLLATRNELVGGVAPEGMRIEAYTWPITSFVGGIAIGATVSGVLVEGPGWRTAFVVAAGFAALGALVAFAARRTLAPAIRAAG
jgi:MFS family permease